MSELTKHASWHDREMALRERLEALLKDAIPRAVDAHFHAAAKRCERTRRPSPALISRLAVDIAVAIAAELTPETGP